MNAMVQYMGYILTGHECALFMPDDGWENLKELFDEIKMAPAESYDFICADDYTEEIAAADLEKRRATIESKQHAETYARALAQLSQSTGSIKDTLDCANAIKESGIVEAPVIDEATRSDLLACINDCGNGISEMRLSMDAVRLLKSKGDAFATQIKIVWRDASAKYSDGSKGYLSMIGGLSSNPKRATELADNITKTVAGEPSIKAVKKLVADVSEAKKIADEFSLNPEIEVFLKKVSSLQATVADLTPDILTWLKGKNLTSKLKIRF